MTKEAPGLKRIKRKSGQIAHYWVARADLRKKGYEPKTVQLFGDDEIAIASRCRILQAEMLQWESSQNQPSTKRPQGTIGWLCHAFETDAESPIHGLRRATQLFYSRYLGMITGTVGARKISEITGLDIRRWHKNWNDKHGARSAYACIQTLRRAISYGCELVHEPSLKLSTVLENMRFKAPKARKSRVTYDLVQAFLPKAETEGHAAVALAILLQFELGLRQKDVIGEWVPHGEKEPTGIIDGQWRWQWGLTWGHINEDWVLAKPTSKSNGEMTATHDITRCPDLLARLQAIPKAKRIGPLIIDQGAGRPYRASHFSQTFRRIATKAGWPKDVWNMDSRAGSVTEAFEAGAKATDVMKHATHTVMSTTMIYNREGLEQAGRVADARQARRKKEQAGNKAE